MKANTGLEIKKFSFAGSLLCSRRFIGFWHSAMDVTQCFSGRTPICWWDPLQTYKDLLKPLEPEVYYNLQSCAFSDRVQTTFQWLEQKFRDSWWMRDVLLSDSFCCPRTKQDAGTKDPRYVTKTKRSESGIRSGNFESDYFESETFGLWRQVIPQSWTFYLSPGLLFISCLGSIDTGFID